MMMDATSAVQQPKAVNRFEAHLLRILWFLFRRLPIEQALPLVSGRHRRPPCLSRTAVELIQDTLAKGSVFLLATSGGWRRERWLRGEEIASGRLWEISSPEELALSFSPQSLEFLMWLTAEAPTDPQQPLELDNEALTLGDRYLLYLAYHALRKTDVGTALGQTPAFLSLGLCWLAFPDDFAENERAFSDACLEPWVTDEGTRVLEALTPQLAEQWVTMEQAKGRVHDCQWMLAWGKTQQAVLSAYFRRIDEAGRRDLARFFLLAMHRVLSANPPSQNWTGHLSTGGLRMADRMETYRKALSAVQQLLDLQRWEQEARSIGYFDEGYQASQLWKTDWENLQGDELCRKAEALLRDVEPLQQRDPGDPPSHSTTGEEG